MAEAKKPRTRSAKSAPKADLIALAAAPTAAPTETIVSTETTPDVMSLNTESVAAATAAIPSAVREQSDALRQAMREAATLSAQGALEVSDKIIDAVNAQRHAALDLWLKSIGNPAPLPERFNAQTHAAREAFETASAQWKDIAETTSRWMTKSFEPLQTAIHRQAR